MTLLPLALSLGCLSDLGHQAPSSYQVDTVDSVLLVWDSSYNDYDDGLGALIPIDALVTDEYDMPRPDIRVEFISGSSGIYVLPEAAIQEVDPPDPQEAGSNCTPGAEDYDIENCAWYDSDRDRYFELSSTYSSEYKPNYAVIATDEVGRARMWIYVDTLPSSGDDEFDPAFVTVTLGTVNGTSTITIESSS